MTVGVNLGHFFLMGAAFPMAIPLEILGNMCYTGFASWGMRLESARDRCTPLASAQFTPNKHNSLDCGIAADHIGATQCIFIKTNKANCELNDA